MSFAPTAEQTAIFAAAATGQHLVIEAYAGTGKTTVCRGIASLPEMAHKRGMYWAYNRAVADDAAASFPMNVRCKTGHGFCYGAMIQQYPHMRKRLNMAAQSGKDRAKMLGINGKHRITEDVVLAPTQVARLALETVDRYSQSGDNKIEFKHVASQTGLEDYPSRRALATIVLPYARKAWADILDPAGKIKWQHDYYVKLSQLAGTVFGAEFMFLDEAQDSSGVTVAIARTQQAAGTQILVVGDRYQELYGWRGATNSMGEFGGDSYAITKSFRFGHAIAGEGSKWLTVLNAPSRVVGHDPIPSRLATLVRGQESAVLCRTNAQAIREVMAGLGDGRTVALVDGKHPGQGLLRFADACDQLREQSWTSHPELATFNTWGEVQDFVDNDHGGGEFATAVKLIDEYGSDGIRAAVSHLVPEALASLVVSTAHKAKGREWDRVRIADDFKAPPPDDNGFLTPTREEAMLAYVAVTRAKLVLDRGPLEYVDEALSGTPENRAVTPRPAAPAPVAPVEPAKPCNTARGDGKYPGMVCDLPTHDGDTHSQGDAAKYGPDHAWTNPPTTDQGAPE